MKKVLLIASVILVAVSSCNSQPDMALSEENIKHEIWSDQKIFDLLPDNARMAVCAFNGSHETIDSLSSLFTDCHSTVLTYRGKAGYILKDNTTNCQTIGTADDLIYYEKSGVPVLHFIQRYLPSMDITMQTLVLFEKGEYKNAFSRSVGGNMPALLSAEQFSTYEPMLGEHRVDKYEK